MLYFFKFQRNTKYDFLGASPDGLVTEIFAGIIVGARDSIKFENEKPIVKSESQSFHFDKIVIACGAFSKRLTESDACLFSFDCLPTKDGI